MRICTIGGTNFSGRAFTGLALEAGHDVTVFHRGRGGRPVAGGRTHPRRSRGRSRRPLGPFVRRDRRLLRVRAPAGPGGDGRDPGRAIRVHLLGSAHVEQVRAGATEVDDVYGPPFPDTEDVTWETYGPLKVACEQSLLTVRGDGATMCGRTTSSGPTTRPTVSPTGCVGPRSADACLRPRRPISRCR